MELSTCSRVREQTVQLQASYASIMGNLQSLLSRLEKTMTDHTDFVKAKDDFTSWLERAQGTVNDCSGHHGDEEAAREKYELVRTVASRLTEGQHLLNVMMDTFTKALNACPVERQEGFREAISTLRDCWDQLNICLNDTLSKLKGSVNRWEGFKEALARMESWLSGMEQMLYEYPLSKGEVGEMKTLMERLKGHYVELERKKPDLDHLRCEAGDLSSMAKNSKCSNTVDSLHLKWNDLVMLSQNYRSRLALFAFFFI